MNLGRERKDSLVREGEREEREREMGNEEKNRSPIFILQLNRSGSIEPDRFSLFLKSPAPFPSP